MASVSKIITPGEISVLVDWPLSQGEGHKLSASPLAKRWCNTPKTSVYICMKHQTLIKVRTADPAWLLYNISVYKNRPWKNKKWDQFLERLVSPCRSLSQTLAEFPSGARSLPSLLILPGLLRSDQGGLSVSSPSGEQKDSCGLRKWCKLLVLKFYWFPAYTKLLSLFSPLNFPTELSLFYYSLYL